MELQCDFAFSGYRCRVGVMKVQIWIHPSGFWRCENIIQIAVLIVLNLSTCPRYVSSLFTSSISGFRSKFIFFLQVYINCIEST